MLESTRLTKPLEGGLICLYLEGLTLLFDNFVFFTFTFGLFSTIWLNPPICSALALLGVFFLISLNIETSLWIMGVFHLHMIHGWCPVLSQRQRIHVESDAFIHFVSQRLHFLILGEHLRTWERVLSLTFHRPLVLWRGCPVLSVFDTSLGHPLLSFLPIIDLEHKCNLLFH